MSLGRRAFCFLLLLPVILSFSKKAMEKRLGLGSEDMTPLCTSNTQIIVTVCKIQTGLHQGNSCQVRYSIDAGFTSTCDPRFQLKAQNATVFLHLTALTLEDNGMYLCNCAYIGGANEIQLNITVEDFPKNEEISDNKPLIIILCSVIPVVIIGVAVGLIYKRKCCRQQYGPARREETDPALQELSNDLQQQTVNEDSPEFQAPDSSTHTRKENGNI